jgi:hypothetical protein
MSKKLIITIVVFVLLLGGAAAAYFVSNNNDNNQQAENTENTSQTTSGDQTSLKSLLAQNRNLTCSYSGTDGSGNQNSGTVYIAGERVRGNFVLVYPDGKQYKSNMIQDGTYMYLWEDGSVEGFRYDISKFRGEDDANKDDSPQNQGIDQDQQFNFDCQNWTVDESKFQVPANVNFADFSAQIEQSQEQLQAACAAITEPTARAACENAAR